MLLAESSPDNQIVEPNFLKDLKKLHEIYLIIKKLHF